MITLGDNVTIPATGQGRVLVRINAGDHYERAVLQGVLYVPDMGGKLLSVSHFARRGAEKAKAANLLTNAKTPPTQPPREFLWTNTQRSLPSTTSRPKAKIPRP